LERLELRCRPLKWIAPDGSIGDVHC
jgi:hypothetical protein